MLEDLLTGHAEHRVAGNAVNHIVLEALLLDALASSHGVLADALVQVLTVAAALYGVHHDVLGCHERQLVHNVRLDDLRVNDQTGNDVDHDVEDCVNGKECLRHGNALVRRVVERALEPLGSRGERRIQAVADNVARQCTDTLRAHRIALVRHSGRADLVLLERLLYFLQVLQQTQVGCELGSGFCDTGQRCKGLRVDLAGVGLTGDRNHACKAEIVGNALLQLLNLALVAVKQLHEGRLRAGRALAAEHAQVFDAVFYLIQIHQQLVHPQGSALADGGQLCGLEVGEAEGRLGLVRICELRQLVQYGRQLFANQQQTLADLDDVGIVADIRAGSAEVDNAGRLGSRLAEGVNVRHNVMAYLLLALTGHIVVDVGQVRGHLVHLLLRDRQTERPLRLSQRQPQPTPGGELHIRGEGVEHLLGSVARRKRAFVHVVHVIRPFRCVFYPNYNEITDLDGV